MIQKGWMSWRDTLFIWRGSAKCTKGVLEWKGSWVGVESPAAKDVKVPPKARFSKSRKNVFADSDLICKYHNR